MLSKLTYLISGMIFIATAFASNDGSSPPNPHRDHLFEHVRYVDEMLEDFGKEMEEKYALHPTGVDGIMSDKKVESIHINFSSVKKLSLEETRRLITEVTTALMKKTNENEKLKPYLESFPFKWKRFDIKITFQDPERRNRAPVNGPISECHLYRGKIAYQGVKMEIVKTISVMEFQRARQNNEKPKEEDTENEEHMLVLKESFEEALQLVGKKAS